MGLFTDPGQAPDGLTNLMLVAVPENSHGNKTLSHLADLIGVSKWGLRKWINAQKIPPERAMQIAAISEGRVKAEQFNEYVYKL